MNEFIISKLVTRAPRSSPQSSPVFYMIMGSSKGVSTNWKIDIRARTAEFYDQLLKSEGTRR